MNAIRALVSSHELSRQARRNALALFLLLTPEIEVQVAEKLIQIVCWYFCL